MSRNFEALDCRSAGRKVGKLLLFTFTGFGLIVLMLFGVWPANLRRFSWLG
jgi:hypothetical protein